MEKTVEYSIRNVTVFPDRAQVNCVGHLNVDELVSSLIFENLPLSIDPDSLRVGGKGKAKVRILGVDISSHHFVQTPSLRVREIEEKLEQYRDEMAALDDRYDIWEAQLEHLQGLRMATDKYAKGLSTGKRSVDDQTQIIDFLRKQDVEIRTEQREIQGTRRKLERLISKLDRELAELLSERPHRRFKGQVAIEVVEPGEFWPELVYVVNKAEWRPLYDIRYVENQDGNNLELSLIAQISQRTGQEWNQAQLAVSTARPAINQRLPKLHPWYVDELHQQPRLAKSRAVSPEPAMSVMSAPVPEAVLDEVAVPEFTHADIVQANLSENGTTVSFNIPGSWDIPSDGSPHKMSLASFSLDPDVDYLAIPRHTDAVFRRATIANKCGSTLLKGDASVFVDNEFIGKSQIEHTPIDEKLELLLGVEERIVIERELTRRKVDKRLLRENRILQYAYEIKVRNLLPKNVKVELQDQFPVSKHEQIKIKLEHANPEPSEINDLNILEWNLELAPEAEILIGIGFSVEHPADMRIRGLFE